MTEGLDLDALREDARQWAAGIPLLADALLEASTRRLLVSGTASRDLLLLRSGRFGLRFYLSKQRTRIRLFRSRDEAPQMVLDAGLSLRIEPLRDEDPQPRPASAPQRCTLSLPSFLVVRPTREELARALPAGARPRDAVLFRVGPGGRDLLAFAGPRGDLGDLGDVRVRYWNAGAGVDVRPHDRRWPVAPFAAFVRAMGEWAGGHGAMRERPMRVPESDDASEARRILRALADAWRAARDAVSAPRRRAPDPLASVRTDYGIGAFDAQVTLRLRPDGTLAEDAGDDTLQIAMDVAIDGASGDMRVALKPPDFLVGGDLHRAFVDAIASREARDRIAGQAGAQGFSAPMDAAAFAAGGGARAMVFRTRRDLRRQRDLDVVILSGEHAGRPRALVVSGWFSVVPRAAAPVTLDTRSLEVLFWGHPDSGERRLTPRTVRHCLRVAAALKDWASTVAV